MTTGIHHTDDVTNTQPPDDKGADMDLRTNSTTTTSVPAGSGRSPRLSFRAGWGLLVVLTALLIANHALGLLRFASSDDERALFAIYVAFGVLSLVVLSIPYRHLERWSWWAMWIPVVANALPLLIFPIGGIGAMYAGFAVVMATAQLMTLRAFRPGQAA